MNLKGIQDYSVIITDTSCFILLEKINAFDVLNRLFQNVVTTPEIQHEFGSDLPPWVQIKPVKDIALMKALTIIVDLGEASAIALAMETPQSLIIIIDDLKGRKLAAKMELTFMGTLGMLLKAKEYNIIAHIRPYVDIIQLTNFRYDQPLIDYVLEVAGEK
jgi:predicted nucleic acid-binding protein